MLIAREVAMAARVGVEVLISAYSCLPFNILLLSFFSFDILYYFPGLTPQVAIVVGGRNFFCGDTWVNTTGLDRTTAYQIG